MRQSASAVMHAQQAQNLERTRGLLSVEDNVMVVEVASRAWAARPAWPISTWSCCCCQFSQLDSRQEALDYGGKT
jgi:hypothetical protein